MIRIKKSKTADTRTCDVSTVTKEQLRKSSLQHIGDVQEGMEFFIKIMQRAESYHDFDKRGGKDLDKFYKDFKNNFETTDWWDNHRKVSRHHLLQEDGIPEDVNLVDVLEMIVDCVMAGMGRNMEGYYPPEISPDVLMDAFNNTAKLLESQIEIVE